MSVSREASGALLRDARRRAGLSQAELASRAGITQSVISVYESGHRQPALSTLAALVQATGYDLDVRLRPRSLDRLTGPVGRRVRRHRRALLRAAHENNVRVHGVFGSVARGQDRPDSDVDLLVDLPSDLGLLGLARIRHSLEDVVRAPVELIPAADLKPGVRPSVLAELIPL